MSAFSIDEVAIARIQFIFRMSKCREPAARLYDSADAGHSLDEYMAARRAGKKTTQELEDMARARFDKVRDRLRLRVDACESAAHRSEDMRDISGITFVLDSKLAERLSECCLTFEDGNFLLKSAGNDAHSLRSFLMKKSEQGRAE
jgi:hypothetical protein